MDPSAPLPGGSREEDARDVEFDREEVLQHLNFDCINLGGREGEQDSDSDEVRLTASSLIIVAVPTAMYEYMPYNTQKLFVYTPFECRATIIWRNMVWYGSLDPRWSLRFRDWQPRWKICLEMEEF